MITIPPEQNRDTYNSEGKLVSVPTFKGTVLVVGTAEPMMHDFLRARNHVMRKGKPAPVAIGVNRTCQFIATDANFCLDRDNAEYWKFVAINKSAKWHSCQPGGAFAHRSFPWIDAWWPGVAGSGTSAWGAAKVAFMMGFDSVILCGSPLEQGPYADGLYAKTFQDDMQTINQMRMLIEQDTWMHPHVSSMSGWTREFLGAP
jgi:hypothetical protein